MVTESYFSLAYLSSVSLVAESPESANASLLHPCAESILEALAIVLLAIAIEIVVLVYECSPIDR